MHNHHRLGLKMVVLLLLLSLATAPSKHSKRFKEQLVLQVLGIAQDAGYPQANCKKDCCKKAWNQPKKRRLATSLGLQARKKVWMFDASPDFKYQLQALLGNPKKQRKLAGIFLTHAHIGHYTGLMHLGREVMGAKKIKVYAMPRMKVFLENNGPWSQLVKLKNVQLVSLQHQKRVQLQNNVWVTPFLVPHRDEFSETVGYSIQVRRKKILFIPDIDKWKKWKVAIEKKVQQHDVSFLDGTFFDQHELPGRNMSQIPHPFIIESVQRFGKLPTSKKRSIHFIHFNHTNRAFKQGTKENRWLVKKGFSIAKQGQIIHF